MADKDVQIQINEINNKLDLLLNYVNEQRLKSQAVEDLERVGEAAGMQTETPLAEIIGSACSRRPCPYCPQGLNQ